MVLSWKLKSKNASKISTKLDGKNAKYFLLSIHEHQIGISGSNASPQKSRCKIKNASEKLDFCLKTVIVLRYRFSGFSS